MADGASEVCMSRHLDNIGKPRPTVEWTTTYGCSSGHEVTASVCNRCAVSLVDGQQRCAQCFQPMVVTLLNPVTKSEQ